METMPNNTPTPMKKFLDGLKIHLDTQLYYYGSCVRYDNFPNQSDIDVCLFTNNESTTILQFINYLKLNNLVIDKKDFNKFEKTFGSNSCKGYKIQIFLNLKDSSLILNSSKNFTFEEGVKMEKNKSFLKVDFSIHFEKDKEKVLKELNFTTNIPGYAVFLMLIVKILYYTYNLITWQVYSKLKGKIFNYSLNIKETIFELEYNTSEKRRVKFMDLYTLWY